ncbi:hypothetical protein FQN60_015881 [Etheostoma spectabile]|uniref:Uncharacterized protein n=1 Tax=Etheostoma spectabile TaxID=54343 RepID=A0A5J5CS15_9PERO|nr:hypothetical protein FQN60_015881 [Etheostoma spectabile]
MADTAGKEQLNSAGRLLGGPLLDVKLTEAAGQVHDGYRNNLWLPLQRQHGAQAAGDTGNMVTEKNKGVHIKSRIQAKFGPHVKNEAGSFSPIAGLRARVQAFRLRGGVG